MFNFGCISMLLSLVSAILTETPLVLSFELACLFFILSAICALIAALEPLNNTSSAYYQLYKSQQDVWGYNPHL